MGSNYNFGREAFYSGIKYYNEGNYVNARACFEIAIKNPKYQESSIYKLIKIDLKEGKYAKVRETLKSDINLNDIDRYRLCGLLEKIENNFKTSQYYFQKCLMEPRTQYIAFLEMAKIYMQLGDYTIAQRMLETLQLNNKYTTVATFELIYLKISEGNYEDAYALLSKVNYNIRSTFSTQYKMLNIFLLKKLGRMTNSYNPFNPSTDYWICRLIDNNDKDLIEHMQKHLNPEERQTNGCFFENTNLNELVSSVKEKISKMNPNHFELSDLYKFRFDYPIGYKGDSLTSDIAVTTILDTQTIITMYPVQLSSEYNREGFLYDQTISLKRKQGMK